jgi:NADPH:quinone reductase-like Zn-dependent oxidoreductase
VALITDPLGGNHWKKSFRALRSTGRLGMFGISLATTSKLFGAWRLLPLMLGMPLFHPLSLMNRNKSAFGVNLGHMWHEADMIAAWMQILLTGVADGWVRPHVDKTFPLVEVGTAQTYIEERKNTGKVVLTT